ncbi:AAA family ATPase [Streptomyces sp. VRA16 Mangrove soil]|uniref:AAA family ATPase n=1 Tax=Streptomyces sp. VRA16 Mangrove soil TaxID=2817434 RepID=UPI001A9DF290|nr:LuxR family transcriptional regulator [Streptomyces sp. VRA16 Mangrove soil]MBO1329876.1 helix-turn-helix domain-containing protein [Streptomyces sp. VRA16 Mangrove soil]
MNTQIEASFFAAVRAAEKDTHTSWPSVPASSGATAGGRLVGRESELRDLRTFVRDATAHGATRAVRGVAGSGKSELLEAAVESATAAGLRVLRCSGSRIGTPLDLSGLLQILWPLLGGARLPLASRDRQALETLLMDGAPARVDRARLPYTVLRVLEAAGAQCPLLIAVDDWDALDAPSADVLAFVARRTAGHRIGVLLTSRTHPARTASLTGLPEVSLRPLTRAESAALLAARRPGGDPRAVHELLATAAGNPLALLELPTDTDDPLPYLPASSDRLTSAMAPGVQQLPAATRDLLLVAALHPTADIPLLLSAASRIRGGTPDFAAVEPAERQGIVDFDGMRMAFSHPAMAGAVVHGTDPSRCRAAHAALAAELKQDSPRQLWHLSQSVEGTDPDLAGRLEDIHRFALRQNEPVIALRLLRRAAALYDRPQDRGRCVLRGAQLAQDTGWERPARSLAHQALEHPLGPLGRLYAQTLTRRGPVTEVAADPAAWPVPAGAFEVECALELAQLTAPDVTGDPERAEALVAYLDALPADVAHDPRLLHAMATAAPVRRAATLISRLSVAGRDDNVGVRDLERLGEAALRAGAPLHALELHRQAERRCLLHELYDRLPATLLWQGLAQLVTGDWGQAEAAFRRCAEQATERALRGETAAAHLLEQLTRGLRTGTVPPPADPRDLDDARPSMPAIGEIVAVGTGWAQVESGDVTAGYATLARLLAAPERCTPVLFALVPFAEAAGAVHAAASARARLRLLEEELGPECAPLVAVELAVARAVLADDEDAVARVERAFATDLSHRPFLGAALRLTQGRRLRRRYEFTDSRVTLRQAAATFTMMGAEARVARITEELRASGERADAITPGVPRPATAADLLSSQELRIARFAARGLSNRQIGAELGLSPRTIGAYLYRIFPRLGVTSRTQLAGALRDESAV